ncbi:MAG: sugar phosphate isomerase/epimerase [Bacteroidota bacterium]|nr:sugar phosphate isomerase/epimerase [Bacteroidota bacterium]
MKKINRRQFIGKSALGLGSAFVLAQLPKELFAYASKVEMPIGFQSWSVKDELGKDLTGTLQMMKGYGYSQIEMCSPKGYADIGFGPLAKMKTSDLRKTIADAGFGCISCHFGFGELADDKIDESIEFAKEMGLTQMICSTFWLPKTATLSDYKASADKLNKAAEKIKQAGMHTGFHNHEFEFATLDGQLIYDAMMNRFDPELVKMQFQTEVINLGYKAADYFKKYPGRFISSHLSDWTADKKEVPIGDGIIDWREFFAAAKTGGVQNIFVEMDLPDLKDSAHNIQKMKV